MSARNNKNRKENLPGNSTKTTNQIKSDATNVWTTKSNAGEKIVNNMKKSSDKFQAIQKKHIKAAQKHIENYESSSEEELENDSLLESVFKSYGGDKSQLHKTQEFLENVFQSGTATCLICIASVKRTDYVIYL